MYNLFKKLLPSLTKNNTYISSETVSGVLVGGSASSGKEYNEIGIDGVEVGGESPNQQVIQPVSLGGVNAGGLSVVQVVYSTPTNGRGGLIGGTARPIVILYDYTIFDGGVLLGGAWPEQVLYNIYGLNGIEASGISPITVYYYIVSRGGVEVINTSLMHYEHPNPLKPPVPRILYVTGSALCSMHADPVCDEGLMCVTNIPNRHKHCFKKAYYIPRKTKTRLQPRGGAFVAAITVCVQGPFVPLPNPELAPKT